MGRPQGQKYDSSMGIRLNKSLRAEIRRAYDIYAREHGIVRRGEIVSQNDVIVGVLERWAKRMLSKNKTEIED